MDEIKCIRYKDAVVYKFNNSHMTIRKYRKGFLITSRSLVILKNKKDIKKYKIFEAEGTELIYRKHSKYAIWVNNVVYSLEAITCLGHSIEYFKKLD